MLRVNFERKVKDALIVRFGQLTMDQVWVEKSAD